MPTTAPHFLRQLLIGLLVFGSSATSLNAADAIKPPFSVAWKDSTSKITRMLKGSKAKIDKKQRRNGREVWTISGINQPSLKNVLFYFKSSLLNEVELQYSDPIWTTESYRTFTTEVRENIIAKHGVGQLIVRSRTQEGNVTQNVLGYKWFNRHTELKLYDYTAERGNEIHRMMSLHYISRW